MGQPVRGAQVEVPEGLFSPVRLTLCSESRMESRWAPLRFPDEAKDIMMADVLLREILVMSICVTIVVRVALPWLMITGLIFAMTALSVDRPNCCAPCVDSNLGLFD